jgi:hypothetical protein
MNGLDIVKHGVDMLLRNLGPALRVSVGPFLIAAVVSVLLAALGLGGMGLNPSTGEVEGGLGLVLGGLIMAIVFLFVFSWVAVAWHRYILKEEKPGLLPPLRSDLVWPYLGRSILIALILVLVAIPLSLILGLVVGGTQSVVVASIVGLVMALVLGWIGTRLSLVLPARAIERPMTFGESWGVTGSASGAIFVVVLILALLNVVLGGLFALVLGDNIVSALLSLVVQWFTTMLGLSVLTTLYGHLVERRPLAA